MGFLADVARVVASEESGSVANDLLSESPNNVTALLMLADLNWRKKDWTRALFYSQEALAIKPRSFQALAIAASCYGYLEESGSAYVYSKRLLRAKRPNWTAVKAAYGLVGLFKLFSDTRRHSFFRTLKKCDAESATDESILNWASELVSRHEAANPNVAT